MFKEIKKGKMNKRGWMRIERKWIFYLFCFFVYEGLNAQDYVPPNDHRLFTSDTILFTSPRPWKAAGEVIGLNLTVWGFDRFVVGEDWAQINFKSIKSNFKKRPRWDTDKFTTNLFAHPYHGGLYFNAARTSGMNFWQSIPFTLGGSLMWEYFMELEPPSVNDMIATTFGGITLGEVTYRLSDLLIDDRSSGGERITREILAALLSPVRGINRLISGDAWRKRTIKNRAFPSTPVNFEVMVGPRFLAEENKSKYGTTSMNVTLHIDYGTPFNDEFYSPYEWFRFNMGLDVFSYQPLISQINAIGALWGKKVWGSGNRALSAGLFQHFDYYNSEFEDSGREVAPYRISEAAAVGGGLIYYRKSTPVNKTSVFTECYVNGIALGASRSDYMMMEERDYNLGSGYSTKLLAGTIYNKKLAFILNLENYHIFTWKGYEKGTDWETVDPETLNVQGDKGNARLTVFSLRMGYQLSKHLSLSAAYRNFARRTKYEYFDTVDKSTYDVMMTLGVII